MGAMACETGGAKRARWGHDGGATVLPSGASEAAQCRCARRLLLPLRSLAAFATRRFSPRGSAVGIAGRRRPTARRVAVNRSETQRAAALAPRAGCAAPCAARAARPECRRRERPREEPQRRPQGATEPSAGRSGRQATVAKPERVPTGYISGEWENVFHQPDGVWCGGEWDERWGMSAAGGVARDGEMVGMSAAGTSPARNDRARRIVARLAAFCKPGERVLPVALPDEDTHAHGS